MHGRSVLKLRSAFRRQLLAAFAFVAISSAFAKTPPPPDSVAIKVGKTVSVMFTQDGDRLIAPSPLPAPVDGESVLTFKLEQTGPMCTLFITNGFGKTLNYRTLVRYRGQSSPVESPAVPVRPYREGVMSFAARVEEVWLYELRLVD